MARKTHPTDYWTFFCNPRFWEVDRFLLSGYQDDSYRIIPYQRNWFEIGQLGVIRVGIDRRTKAELNGRKKLIPGIYAVVSISGLPEDRSATRPEFYLKPNQKSFSITPRVQVSIVKNLLNAPLLLENLKNDDYIREDPYLLKGFQGGSMPLHPLTMQRLLELSGI